MGEVKHTSGPMPEPVTQHYADLGFRIVEFFDKDETAGSFLREDGDGGFVGGLYRMAREIDALRGVLRSFPGFTDDASVGDPWAEAKDAVLVDTANCEMGVGCNETGICYAKAQGEPDRCARPVEEPGEVERITRKAAMLEKSAGFATDDVARLEAALAETQERLVKAEVAAINISGHLFTVNAALNELQSAASAVLVGISVHNGLHADALARRDDIEGPIISQLANAAAKARAALTSDAQEAGR